MDNMETIIKAHNSKIKDLNKILATCNCRKKEDCPLPGKCTIQNVIYKAKVKTPNEEKTYIGLTATSFKARYMNHKASFNNRAKSNQTELSKHIWKLKDDGSPYTLTWTIKKRAQSVSTHLYMQAQEDIFLVWVWLEQGPTSISTPRWSLTCSISTLSGF